MTDPLPAPAEHPPLETVERTRRDLEPDSASSLEEALRGERHAEARAFLLALAALDGAPPDSDQVYELSAKAADALVRLAELDGHRELAQVLRPDPARASATWTVACYRIGDLVPASLHDYTDPVHALRMLAYCSEEDHVAAELIASNDQGVQWCALIRSGDQLAFRIPTDESLRCSDPTDEAHTSALAGAAEHWRERLILLGEHPGTAPLANERSLEHTEPPNESKELSAVDTRLSSLEAVLASLCDRLSELEVRLAAHLVPEELPAPLSRRASRSWPAVFRRRAERW